MYLISRIYDSHTINYKVPFNYKEIDRSLFYNENFSFTIPSVNIVEFKNAFLSSDTIFSNGCVLDSFIRHKKVSIWNQIKRIVKLFGNKIKKRNSGILGFQMWSNNYFHWMTETLPAIWVMTLNNPGVNVLIPQNIYSVPFVEQSLKQIGIHCEAFDEKESLYIKKLFCIIVPHVGRFNHFLLHSFTFAVKKTFSNFEEKFPFRKIFISRRKASRRKILNESLLCETLAYFGFEIIVLEDLPIVSQIQYFFESQVVVSSHGAGLSNVMYMAPGTSVLELKANDNDYWCFFSISRVFQLNYGYMLCESDGRNHRDADIYVDIDKFKSLLTKFISSN